MKSSIIIPLMLAAIMLVNDGCKKSSSLTETWTWKGTTYTSTSATESSEPNSNYGTVTTLSAQSGSSTLDVSFNGSLPAQSVMDTVIAWGLGTVPIRGTTVNEVNISLGINGNTYQSTGGNGTQTINVTVSGNTTTVSVPQSNPSELLNIASGSVDSSGIYFTITYNN